MKNVRILDCTLRDGGRIINCAFPDSEIREVSSRLSKAKIEIIEVGFLRDWRKVNFKGNSTFFTDVDQIAPYLGKTDENTVYVAFIDFGMFDFESLKPCNGASVTGIRFGFTRSDFANHKDEIVAYSKLIMEKGYRLFIQGVNTLSYSDRELLDLIEMVNEIQPYSFGIVDTYGAMYVDDLDRIYSLVDHNMRREICIDFHSHNNYQLSFAFAQEIIKLSDVGTRQIIIDSTLGGMGKVAGNLNTELIVDYLIRKRHYDYELDDIFDILDDYIYKYSMKYKWGFSAPAMMAGIYNSHPNNVIYLTEKFRLESKDMGKILSMIETEKRQRYDYDTIERLYIEYISDKVDDTDALNTLRKLIGGREVLVLIPGSSLRSFEKRIMAYIAEHDVFVISVNIVTEYENAYAFFGNKKRYKLSEKTRKGKKVIVSSNIHPQSDEIVVNYHSLINRGYKYFENSAIMLLNLLKRLGCCTCISIAGFDGFDSSMGNNYYDESFQNDRHIDEFNLVNKEVGEMFGEIEKTLEGKCQIRILTPSRFAKGIPDFRNQ